MDGIDEIDEMDYAYVRPLTYNTASYTGERMDLNKFQKSGSSLEDLPAELLEIIAWFSLSPVLSLVSKKIFQKLGHMKVLRRDMALLVFCNWDEVYQAQNARFPHHRLHVNISRLCFRSPIALSSPPPTLSMIDLQALRSAFGEMRWCNTSTLRDLGLEVMSQWWDFYFSHDTVGGSSKEAVFRYIRNANGKSVSLRYPFTYGQHTLIMKRPYEASIMCSDGRRAPVCPYYGTKSCPKNRGFKLSAQTQVFPSKIIFALPNVPEYVLLRLNDTTKGEQIDFYHRGIDTRTEVSLNVFPDWSPSMVLRRPLKLAIVSAVKEKQYKILQKLLREQSRGPTKSPSIYDIGRSRTNNGVPGQLILTAMAHSDQWQEIMDISKRLETVSGPYRTPKKLGLEAADEDLRAIILSYADEAILESDDEQPLKMLEWWIKDPTDLVPDSWSSEFENLLPEPSLADINERAMKVSGGKVHEKVEHIRKKIKLQHFEYKYGDPFDWDLDDL